MSEDVVVWFNPRCSKSRAVRDLLEAEQVRYRLRPYLDEPPARRELVDLLEKLGTGARGIARTKEEAWSARGLDDADDDAILDALMEEPALIERPIAIRGDRAVIARPPERVREIL